MNNNKVYLCLYKGPVTVKDSKSLLQWFIHFFICIATFDFVSHTEVSINKRAYSSSMMDGGVRDKYIDFSDGKWIVYETDVGSETALNVYEKYKNEKYDLGGATAFVLSFVKQSPNKVFCSELSSNMLCLPNFMYNWPTYKNSPGALRVYCKKMNFRRLSAAEIKTLLCEA